MYIECVVVAEQSRARVFIRDRSAGKFEEVADLTNPDARLHKQDLTSDRPGRTFDSMGSGRHAKEDKTDARKQSAIRFTRELCSFLEANSDSYEKLVLIAPPAFLGLLREHLPDTLAKRVSREIDKDIVRKDMKEIQQYLKL